MNLLYLDMDGVICDFDRRFYDVFGEYPKDARKMDKFDPKWLEFVQTKQFEELEWFPGAQKLLEFIKTLNIKVEMLSSSGGLNVYQEVRKQKLEWLRKHKIYYKANIVPGGSHKARYAAADRILIDDRKYIVDSFYEHGGNAILHRDVDLTIQALKSLLEID